MCRPIVTLLVMVLVHWVYGMHSSWTYRVYSVFDPPLVSVMDLLLQRVRIVPFAKVQDLRRMLIVHVYKTTRPTHSLFGEEVKCWRRRGAGLVCD